MWHQVDDNHVVKYKELLDKGIENISEQGTLQCGKQVFTMLPQFLLKYTRRITVPGRDLNPGPLSFEASALLTELTRLAVDLPLTVTKK